MRPVAETAGSDGHVLDGAPETEAHLASVGIDGAEMTGGVGKELDAPLAHAEQPRLRVVGIARQDGGGHERQRALVTAVAPVSPGLERRPAVDVSQRALLPRANAQTAGDHDDGSTGGQAGGPEETTTGRPGVYGVGGRVRRASPSM